MHRIFLVDIATNQLLTDNEFSTQKEAEAFIKTNYPCKFCKEMLGDVICAKYEISQYNGSNVMSARELFEKHDCTPDMFATFEHDKIELEYYEKLLAARFNLVGEPHEIHNWLIEIDRSNRMVEDELVADWQSAFSSVMMYR
mgnify:FL=1